MRWRSRIYTCGILEGSGGDLYTKKGNKQKVLGVFGKTTLSYIGWKLQSKKMVGYFILGKADITLDLIW